MKWPMQLPRIADYRPGYFSGKISSRISHIFIPMRKMHSGASLCCPGEKKVILEDFKSQIHNSSFPLFLEASLLPC
jgi:hypothetical protein